jgi:hypothetical protein
MPTIDDLLPPDGFSRPPGDAADDTCATLGGLAAYGDLIPDDDPALAQPVLIKAFKGVGRTAVAVTTASGPALLSTSTSAQPTGPQLPPGEPLSRTASGMAGPAGCAAAAANGAAHSPSSSGISRPASSGGGKVAFALNGKLYDSRGKELGPEAGGGFRVVECGAPAAPARASG